MLLEGTKLGQRRPFPSATPLVLGYVVCLYVIPGNLVVEPLGAAGAPAQLLGLALMAWWLASQLYARADRFNPIPWLVLLLFASFLASYAIGMDLPVYSSAQLNSADRAILALGAWGGIALVLSDGLGAREQLDRIVRLIAGCMVVIAFVGILQYAVGVDISAFFDIPGLVPNTSVGHIFERSGFRRIQGTTSHPIEFGVVLAAGLPLVIHTARFAASRRSARLWWVGVGVIGIALPLSVARSSMIGLIIAFALVVPALPANIRWRVVCGAGVGILGLMLVTPGLLGTIKSLFLNSASDPSTRGRTEDYAPVWEYVGEYPVFGRGVGTFIPEMFRTLDNQYLGLLIEAGIVGLGLALLVMVGSAVVGLRIWRTSSSKETADLAYCFLVGIIVIVASAATFDAFAFPACAGTLFLMMGMTGALWRLGHLESGAEPSSSGTLSRRSVRPPLWLPKGAGIGVSLVLSACLLGVCGYVATDHARYWAEGAAVVVAPKQNPGQPAYGNSHMVSTSASLLHDVLLSRPTIERMASKGVDAYTVAVGDGSLMRGTDSMGSGPTIRVASTSDNPASAARGLELVLTEAESILLDLQTRVGTDQSSAIQLQVVKEDGPVEVKGSRGRALAGTVLLFGVVAMVGLRAIGRSVLRLPRRNGAKSDLARKRRSPREV